jgi:hypothetical protein
VCDITMPFSLSYGNTWYVDFGNTVWGAKNLSFYAYQSANNLEAGYKLVGTAIVNSNEHLKFTSGSYSHSRSPSGTGYSYNRLRVVMTNWLGLSPRIAAIGARYYNSPGLSTTLLSLGGGTMYGSVKLNNLTASRTLELDASKNIISAAKQTGYNLALSTTATDIKINGTQSLGSLSTLARADHVHPTDTSRAPTASPTFTGTVVLPSGQALIGPEIVDFAAFIGDTSGATKLVATAVAGSTVLTLPAATDTLVGRNTIDTLTNKTLTAPTITGAGAIAGVFTGNITGNVTGDVAGNAATASKAATISVTANNTTDETTYLTFVDGATGTQDIETDTDLTYNPSTNVLTAGTFAGALTGNAATATKIDSITNSDIVQLTEIQTLTRKTLNRPLIESFAVIFGDTSGETKVVATAVASGTLTLPAATDTLVGKATADILTNKTLTAPTITGAGAIAGVFTGNITGNVTGNVTGNADTVTTNADLTGPVTSSGNITAIANGAITTAMQKHLQTFEFNGYIASAASTNYFIPSSIFENKGPFNHSVDAGSNGLTALAPSVFIRTGGKAMPYAGTCKLWKGWVSASGSGAVNISIFKFTPVAGVGSNVALVLVKNFSTTALTNPQLIAINVDDFTVGFNAGDILITGVSCVSGQQMYFTSTLEVEWN